MGRPRNPAVTEAIPRTGRGHLATDGRTRMTIGTVVADAGGTRPARYRRGPNRHERVVDALSCNLRQQRGRPVVRSTNAGIRAEWHLLPEGCAGTVAYSRSVSVGRPSSMRPVVSHVAGLTWMWAVAVAASRKRRCSGEPS